MTKKIKFKIKTTFLLAIYLTPSIYAESIIRSPFISILELNPLILANQGLGINTEILLIPSFSVGSSIEYYLQMPYDRNSVQATRNMLNLAPFLRYYPFSERLEGLFIGTKLNLTYSQAQIKDNEVSASYNKFYIAPTIHFGYRFVTSNGFTVSAYVGIGVKSSDNKFPSSQIPNTRADNQDWLNAVNKLNQNVSLLEPDYGLTVGYEF